MEWDQTVVGMFISGLSGRDMSEEWNEIIKLAFSHVEWQYGVNT